MSIYFIYISFFLLGFIDYVYICFDYFNADRLKTAYPH